MARLSPFARPPAGHRSGLNVTEQFVFVHCVSTLLPDVAQLLQGGADLLPRRDANPPQVMAADGEAGHRPPAELRQQLLFPLILE